MTKSDGQSSSDYFSAHWKNYLKGIYDRFSADYKFLISGSGRLDIYQRDGSAKK